MSSLKTRDWSYVKNMKDNQNETSLLLYALMDDQKFIEQDNYILSYLGALQNSKQI